MTPFEQAWKNWHSTTNPVGHLMRARDEPNWIRLHSLPLSKRYADTDEEREILMLRQNKLASEVLGEGCPCWLVQSRWVAPEGTVEHVNNEMRRAISRTHKLPWAFRFHDTEYCEGPCDVYAGLTNWKSGEFDELLWMRAKEEFTAILWMSDHDGSVFAPYDGGVDIFLRDRTKLLEMSCRYADWLPQNASEL